MKKAQFVTALVALDVNAETVETLAKQTKPSDYQSVYDTIEQAEDAQSAAAEMIKPNEELLPEDDDSKAPVDINNLSTKEITGIVTGVNWTRRKDGLYLFTRAERYNISLRAGDKRLVVIATHKVIENLVGEPEEGVEDYPTRFKTALIGNKLRVETVEVNGVKHASKMYALDADADAGSAIDLFKTIVSADAGRGVVNIHETLKVLLEHQRTLNQQAGVTA